MIRFVQLKSVYSRDKIFFGAVFISFFPFKNQVLIVNRRSRPLR